MTKHGYIKLRKGTQNTLDECKKTII